HDPLETIAGGGESRRGLTLNAVGGGGEYRVQGGASVVGLDKLPTGASFLQLHVGSGGAGVRRPRPTPQPTDRMSQRVWVFSRAGSSGRRSMSTMGLSKIPVRRCTRSGATHAWRRSVGLPRRTWPRSANVCDP